MKGEVLHEAFYLSTLSSSHHEGRKMKFQFLYLHFIFHVDKSLHWEMKTVAR